MMEEIVGDQPFPFDSFVPPHPSLSTPISLSHSIVGSIGKCASPFSIGMD